MKVRVPVFGTVGKSVVIDLDPKAIFGKNVYASDGKTLVNLADLLGGTTVQGSDVETSDDVDEGIFNLFFTDARAVAAVAAALAASGNITLAYDPDTNEITADLKPTGVTAGNYGDGTNVPTLTVDANGRITAAGQVTVAAAAPLVVNDGEVSTIPANRQMLWTDPIELLGSGSLEIDGALEEVA